MTRLHREKGKVKHKCELHKGTKAYAQDWTYNRHMREYHGGANDTS